ALHGGRQSGPDLARGPVAVAGRTDVPHGAVDIERGDAEVTLEPQAGFARDVTREAEVTRPQRGAVDGEVPDDPERPRLRVADAQHEDLAIERLVEPARGVGWGRHAGHGDAGALAPR